jgi:hypothetical protein
MFSARANFLVALGLLCYTEILGSFVVGEYQKDEYGRIKTGKKGHSIHTTSPERFNAFFRRLGTPYVKLIDKKPGIYNELRCGLAHEYLVKNIKFSIINPDKELNEQEIDSIADCGVIYLTDPNTGSETCYILNPKYFLDFTRATASLISEIESGKNKILNDNFYERCENVNFVNFVIFQQKAVNTSGAVSRTTNFLV